MDRDLLREMTGEKPVDVSTHMYLSDLVADLPDHKRLELAKRAVQQEMFYWSNQERVSARPGMIQTDIDARLESEAKERRALYDQVYELLEKIEKVGSDSYRSEKESSKSK